MVHSPGIGILPIAAMDAHQPIVTAALPAKESAETPRKARWDESLESMRASMMQAIARSRLLARDVASVTPHPTLPLKGGGKTEQPIDGPPPLRGGVGWGVGVDESIFLPAALTARRTRRADRATPS